MAYVSCTRHLEGIGPLDSRRYPGDTVSGVLQAMTSDFPRLLNYVLDDQGRVRKHVAIFVENQLVPNDKVLDRRVSDHAQVFIMQALSGG